MRDPETYVTTEPVTQYLTGDPYELVKRKLDELFAWIKSSFITEDGIDGVSPYSVAMESLIMNLRHHPEMKAVIESRGLKFTKHWFTAKTVQDEPAVKPHDAMGRQAGRELLDDKRKIDTTLPVDQWPTMATAWKAQTALSGGNK